MQQEGLGSPVYIRYKDHVLFKNIVQPIEEAVERETIGWLTKETDEIILVEHDRTIPCLQIPIGQGSGVIILKNCIIELHKLPELELEKEVTTVNETTFIILKWDAQKGVQLGDFDVAYKKSNLQDKWQSAFKILRNSNATIKERYHGTGYNYSYWIYGEDKIYRQKLKPKTC